MDDHLPNSLKTSPEQPLVYRFSSISSASIGRYPNNRPSCFTHHLPKTLFLDQRRHYVISLLSFCLSSHRQTNWKKPAYIRVHLSQLGQNAFSAPERVRCLSQLVLPDRDRDPLSITDLDWFQQSNPTPLLLDHTLPSLTELSFKLTDEKNQELTLDPSAAPTILNCVIEEMGVIERFTLTLNASLSRDRYPTNSDTDFIVSFGSPITDDTKWEVALHSIIIPSGIRVTGEIFEASVELENGEKKIISHKNTGQTADALLLLLQTELATVGVYIQRKDRNHYIVYFEDSSTRTQDMGKALKMNPGLCKLFNFPHFDSSIGFYVTEETEEHRRIFPYGASFDPARKIKVTEQIALYSNMVQSSVFGNARAPLVDILSTVRLGMLENNRAVDTLYTVPNLIFRPVARTHIKEVSLKIMDVFGKEAEFEYKTSDLELQFIFVFRK